MFRHSMTTMAMPSDEMRPFLRLVHQDGAELYHLDDVTPETVLRSLQAYRYWAGQDPNARVHLWTGESMGRIDHRVGEFILQDTLHSLDPLNY
jgi:hypothetical protein